MKFMFGLRHPLTCNPSTTLSNPCNKVKGEYFSKEVFLCLPACILIVPASFIPASLSLCRCELFYIYMCRYVDVNLHMWLYSTNTCSCFREAIRFILLVPNSNVPMHTHTHTHTHNKHTHVHTYIHTYILPSRLGL